MRYQEKELLGKIFRGYINIRMNPQSQYRTEAAAEMSGVLDELQTFFLLTENEESKSEIKELLLLTDTGLERFMDFVREFMKNGYNDRADMSDIAEEQMNIAEWVRKHKKELTV